MTAPPFTVPCEGREARFLHLSHRESNPGPSRGSPLHYRCTTSNSTVMLELIHESLTIIIGRLRFHDDNENEKEISLSFSLRFCTQREERLVASISSSTTTITNTNPGRTKERMISAHKNFVLVLVVVVVVKS